MHTQIKIEVNIVQMGKINLMGDGAGRGKTQFLITKAWAGMLITSPHPPPPCPGH